MGRRLPFGRLRSGRFRFGLLGRVAAALAVVGLVPLLLAAWRLGGINREAMREQVLRANLVAASSAAARISDLVAARAAVLRSAAESPLLAEAPRSAAATELLSGLLAADPHLLAAVVVNDAGREVVRAQRPRAPPPALPGESLPPPGEPALVSVRGSRYLVLSVPLAAAEGRLQGVWDEALLRAPLEPLAAGEQVRLVLGDAEGALLAAAGSDGAPAGAPPDRLPAALLAQARSARLAGAGRFEVAGGAPILAAYDGVAGTPWYVLSHQPAAAAEAVGRRMARDAALAVGLALLLTVALSLLAYASLVRPLRGLLRTQRRMMGLAPRPSEGSEIAQLQDAFSTLERSLRDRRDLERVFLGRYQVLEVLGEGGMGTVFRGWDPRLRRPVALKTLRLDAGGGGRAEKEPQLVEEAILAARIQHPGVVAVYDIEDTPQVTFLAMEYVDGRSLEWLLAVRGPLAVAAVVRIGVVAAAGLAAAHRLGVLHRDVKPGNVLVGRDGTVKVADFGVAALMSSLCPDDDLVYGTPGYIAPEGLRGELVGPAADLFSLGVVLFRALTDEHPFPGRDARDGALATLRRPPRPLGRLRPETPPDLARLVEDLLDKDPRRRPSDGDEVAARLEGVARRHGYTRESAVLQLGDDLDRPDGEVRDAEAHWWEVEQSRFVATVGVGGGGLGADDGSGSGGAG